MDISSPDKNNIVVVAKAEGFLIKGIEDKLKENGLNNQFAALTIKELDRVHELAELYIINLNDVNDDDAEALVYLRDKVGESDCQIILIGEPMDIEWTLKIIPPTELLAQFERPFEMEKLIRTVEKYMDDVESHDRKKRILIVDDDITYMRTIYGWLKDRYNVGMASSGIQAISWLAKNKADLILLDYQMPVADGPQILSMLKSDSATEDVPVMFLTGKDDRDSVMAVMGLKPADYLLKTIDKEGLNNKLETFFVKEKLNKLGN